jgi:hypothetical protein
MTQSLAQRSTTDRTLRYAVAGALCLVLLAGCGAARRPSLKEQESAPPLPTMVRLGNSWREFTRLEMRWREPRDVQQWTYDFATDGVRRFISGGAGGGVGGEILFIEDQLLLTRQLTTPAGTELDLVDDLMLKQQLVVSVLEQAFAQGPQGLLGSMRVVVEDRGQPLHTETSNSSRAYYPPWTVRAQATREDDENLAIEATFDAQLGGAGRGRTRIEIEGRWTKTVTADPLPDDTRLEQWRAFRLRLGTKPAAGLTVAAWVAVPDARRYKTLGDARQSVTPRR